MALIKDSLKYSENEQGCNGIVTQKSLNKLNSFKTSIAAQTPNLAKKAFADILLNKPKEEPKLLTSNDFKKATIYSFNKASAIEDKENINNSNTKNTGNYKIVYDKNYSGIKRRNTPSDEIQNYVIDIEKIINEKDIRTTLMIKNIPSYISQVELLDKINLNHRDNFNFFYLPIDFNKKTNAGYAFINFKSPKMIINFFLEFNSKPWGFKNSNKIAYVSYARIQGYRSISSHFKKSNIMRQVDDKLKPLILG
jgi:hypothetical protein